MITTSCEHTSYFFHKGLAFQFVSFVRISVLELEALENKSPGRTVNMEKRVCEFGKAFVPKLSSVVAQ